MAAIDPIDSSREGDAFTTRRSERASLRRRGYGSLTFRRAAGKTVLAEAFATSPLRLLTPRNHGHAAWVFQASFGGGLVDGDRIELRLEAEAHTSAFVGTQSSTKVYRSPRGCSQRIEVRVGQGAAIAIVPDPVVPFAEARYTAAVDVSLAADASLVLFDATSSGRAARGERWQFARLESRIEIVRDGNLVFADATRLDPAHGPIAERMGGFDVLASLIVIGPQFADVRKAMMAQPAGPAESDSIVWAVSSLRSDVAVIRIAADRFENASRVLRSSFAALARWLGDDPFARKW